MNKKPLNPLALNRRQLGALAFGLVSSGLVMPAHAADLVVIVNSGNRESPSRADLAAMFTTRKQSWNSGPRVVPFNFPPKHPLRVAFDQNILEMSADEVARYWIDRRIRGGNAPPKQVGNAQLLVRLVSKMEGAVAYVPRDAVGAGVRIAATV